MEKQKLPNGTVVLVLGIISILTCCCYGIISIILGAVGVYLAGKDIALYKENPDLYSNYNNVNIGRILSIIGIVLGVIYMIYMIWLFSTIGFENMQNPEVVQQKMRELLGK
ncbi:MAG TPA: CCC motif membrane protein [Flavobacterium sp.]|jgi:uncharacterized membrane protein|nr:CCC motif membrane protein [Flavobacterium sp.]